MINLKFLKLRMGKFLTKGGVLMFLHLGENVVVPIKDAIMRTAIIPTLPVIPAAVKHTAEIIIIKIVIPETGSVPV